MRNHEEREHASGNHSDGVSVTRRARREKRHRAGASEFFQRRTHPQASASKDDQGKTPAECASEAQGSDCGGHRASGGVPRDNRIYKMWRRFHTTSRKLRSLLRHKQLGPLVDDDAEYIRRLERFDSAFTNMHLVRLHTKGLPMLHVDASGRY